ncbi:phage tail protein [Desulfocurvibacter africanus]|uniref:Phage tail fibre protein N-terminal domain-containing protein n=1 Tax=Desulfocurvibacter africanus subsp. africanus str. Walvis Bay TaxID=690850 RepID=F3YY38_DESAF|nr:phage tail protein [Desulfocurvibacter africanus]EGJ51814.1 hypothetical protein Desaf_3533 [Desulfocurvibacter africanus subsp. africanus str. Walvis Bay]
MAEQFYTILTKVGHAKLANALALGQSVGLTHMAVGQGQSGGYYEPTETQTTLKSEAWRGPVNALNVDPQNANWLVAELVIPTSVGNFTVREAGLFDAEGDLIAVGKYPQTYKPQLADGAGKDLYIRLIVQVSNTSVVTLKVDPAVVLATRGYAEDAAEAAGDEAKAYSDARLAAHSAVLQAALDTKAPLALPVYILDTIAPSDVTRLWIKTPEYVPYVHNGNGWVALTAFYAEDAGKEGVSS